jgi:hypothetical protein
VPRVTTPELLIHCGRQHRDCPLHLLTFIDKQVKEGGGWQISPTNSLSHSLPPSPLSFSDATPHTLSDAAGADRRHSLHLPPQFRTLTSHAGASLSLSLSLSLYLSSSHPLLINAVRNELNQAQ